VAPDSFAYEAGLRPGTVVKYFLVNGTELRGVPELTRYLLEVKKEHNNSLAYVTLVVKMVSPEGEEITVVKKSAPVNTSDLEKYERIGIYMFDIPAGFVELLPPNMALHFSIIMTYAVIINFSLAIINAAPLFITDGAQMVSSIVEHYTRDEKKAKIITAIVSILSLLLLIPNITI
jgi:sRNA-binding regulator protein Hfq